MQPCSSLLGVAVFLLGATCGALLVMLQRQVRLERLKTAFASELQAICREIDQQIAHRRYSDLISIPEASNVRVQHMDDGVFPLDSEAGQNAGPWHPPGTGSSAESHVRF